MRDDFPAQRGLLFRCLRRDLPDVAFSDPIEEVETRHPPIPLETSSTERRLTTLTRAAVSHGNARRLLRLT